MATSGPLVLGRYALEEPIASGGMATIYLGRQVGAVGFSRLVAIKRLHPHFASEPDFVAMFLDEARLAARVRHPNVVETLDVVREGTETFIVLELVDGESLAGLLNALREQGERMPVEVATSIVSGLCRGLHAAHEARAPDGAPLGIVHRDVSPHNVLVGADGVARVADFGVALANVRLSQTRAGQVKGKPAYMAPEQLSRDEVTRASDIYASGVVLWELLAGRRAYEVANEGALYARVIAGAIPNLCDVAPWVPPPLAEAVHRALRREPNERYGSALEMGAAIEAAVVVAPAATVGAVVERIAARTLHARRDVAARLDRGAAVPMAAIPMPPPSGPGAPPAAFVPQPPQSVRPPPVVPSDRGERGTHTITSPGPLPGSHRKTAPLVAIAIALLAAVGIGVGATWLALRGGGAASAANASSASPAPSVEVEPTSSIVETTAPSATLTEPPVESDPTASPQATTELPRVPRPSSKPTTSAGSTTTPRPCDPPWFIDKDGIRRVKRECF
ncbi:MAG: serine/threonine protein kinase [Polyangiaceae bacterium]|nr:serine/threonine protein kinase [Polyangiaceae bacterium]